MSGVNSADSLPAGVAAAGGTFYRDWLWRIRSQGRRQGEIKSGTTLVDVLRDAASDASSILAASTSRPERFVTGSLAGSGLAKRILGVVSDSDWTSEGRVKKRRSKKPRPESHDAQPRDQSRGGRMIVDRWTQAILPPGSDENPNTPGI